ncbi:TonB-dependent siderophore receptor [Marinobacterium mangrovicola]|uniref:Outer membrane receptor for ferric coprogen and ferric-rhodotorulic acid n=1 Tax=Marinobacterium mangrovicola TaxID=1476959 RepID=A0A4R1GKK8_9GAMM|nr:TonB-dependent siderophore receptor [Marinobacterium mangrovicola]TCK08967.1 outer membrane receptor for ferric coprogen and ferric-rhodotorulic acid [Marinobacterium mangrovicola]
MPTQPALNRLNQAILKTRAFHLSRYSASAALLAALSAPVAMQVQAAEATFNIPAQNLSQALNTFGQQSGYQVLYSPNDLAGLTSSAVEGRMEVNSALSRLLQGTSLNYSIKGSSITVSSGNGDSASLSAITVTGVAASNLTENTGSYTTAGPTTTATKLPMTLKETPQSVSIITRARMEDQGLETIRDVLEQTPGITVQELGSERYTIYSRGYVIDTYSIDGIPTYSISSTQATPQGLSDMAIYDHIEVLRGANGLMSGAGDPSGTINMVRKRPTSVFQGSITGTTGSWDLYGSQLDLSGPLNEAGTVRGRMVGAYRQGDSFIDYYETEKTVLYGVLEADLSDSTLLTLGVDYQEDAPRGSTGSGFPLFYDDGSRTDFSRSTSHAAKWSSDNKKTYTAFATLEQQLNEDWSFTLAANYMDLDRQFSGAYAGWGFFNEETGDGIRLYGGSGATYQTQTGLDLHLNGSFGAFGQQHDLVFGYSYSQFANSHEPDYGTDVEGNYVNFYTWGNNPPRPLSGFGLLYDLDTVIHQRGVYLATHLNPTDNLALILGTRSSDYDYDYSLEYVEGTGSNRYSQYNESGVVTPYAGIVYDLTPQHSIYASYTSIFQPQSYQDESGQLLEPETGDNYEVGLKSELFDGRVNTAIALYEIKQDNLAEASGGVVEGTTTSAYRAVDGATTRGLDIEINGQITPRWNISASYSHSLIQDSDGERLSSVAPKNMVKLWTTYTPAYFGNKLTLGGGVNWQSDIYFSATTWQVPGVVFEAEQDGYTVVDLMGKYQFNPNLSATVNVNNLFDEEYMSSIESTFLSGYYGEPRNLMLTMKYQF